MTVIVNMVASATTTPRSRCTVSRSSHTSAADASQLRRTRNSSSCTACTSSDASFRTNSSHSCVAGLCSGRPSQYSVTCQRSTHGDSQPWNFRQQFSRHLSRWTHPSIYWPLPRPIVVILGQLHSGHGLCGSFERALWTAAREGALR